MSRSHSTPKLIILLIKKSLILAQFSYSLQALIPKSLVPVEESEDYSPINREITNDIQLDAFMDLITSAYLSEQGG